VASSAQEGVKLAIREGECMFVSKIESICLVESYVQDPAGIWAEAQVSS
jgi:hypothetical protein